jgi:AcrR family transcriptional regulator
MNRHSECDTREHILATGEQLCMHRGFTGMGLSELLKTAEVPKGSFYHYFRSKEAFGVACLKTITPDICSAWSITSPMARATIAIGCWPTISTR